MAYQNRNHVRDKQIKVSVTAQQYALIEYLCSIHEEQKGKIVSVWVIERLEQLLKEIDVPKSA